VEANTKRKESGEGAANSQCKGTKAKGMILDISNRRIIATLDCHPAGTSDMQHGPLR
jgi:hypothetical protein